MTLFKVTTFDDQPPDLNTIARRPSRRSRKILNIRLENETKYKTKLIDWQASCQVPITRISKIKVYRILCDFGGNQ